MKRTGKVSWSWKAWLGAVSLVLVLVLGLTMDQFSIISYAQSQGKVTASSANIRKEANPSSQVVGSAAQGNSVTINHQTTGTDGYTWYQIFVNAETLGYIRSDLVSITDGTTPTTVTSTGTSNTTTPATTPPSSNVNETPAEVTAVSPVSGTVTGSRGVRVRGNASTTSQIITTVENGSALTVTGKATGTDNNVWYQVEFISNGAEVNGFIRSDYVSLSGELTPVVEEPPGDSEGTGEEEPVTVTKDWDTQLQGEEWYLLDMVSNGQYNIADLFGAIEQNKSAYETLQVTHTELEKTVKSQKIVIVILVILLIALGAGAAYLVYKIKDMMDSAYFSAVEKETIRRRSGDSPQGTGPQGGRTQGGQKVMHTVGAEKKSASGSQGSRPTGQPQGNKSASGRPAGAQPQGSRPVSGRPAGAQPQSGRPVGAQNQANRPAGAQPQGGKPAAQAPSGRPTGAQPQGGRPAPQAQTSRPTGGQPKAGNTAQPQRGSTAQPQRGNAAQPQRGSAGGQGWKSKNFMADDDEFEFEFLNWDGEEE